MLCLGPCTPPTAASPLPRPSLQLPSRCSPFINSLLPKGTVSVGHPSKVPHLQSSEPCPGPGCETPGAIFPSGSASWQPPQGRQWETALGLREPRRVREKTWELAWEREVMRHLTPGTKEEGLDPVKPCPWPFLAMDACRGGSWRHVLPHPTPLQFWGFREQLSCTSQGACNGTAPLLHLDYSFSLSGRFSEINPTLTIRCVCAGPHLPNSAA